MQTDNHIQQQKEKFYQSYEIRYQQLNQDYQRLQTDYARLQADNKHQATVDAVMCFLPSLNNLYLYIVNSQDAGLIAILKTIFKQLKQLGIHYHDPIGEQFDSTRMEAIAKHSEGDTVVGVVSPEFWFQGKLLQYAQVVVGKDEN